MWHPKCIGTVLLILVVNLSGVAGVVTLIASSVTGIRNKQPLTLKCNYTANEPVTYYTWSRRSRSSYTYIVNGSVTARTAIFMDNWRYKGVFIGNYNSSLDIQLPARYVTPSFAGTYRCQVNGVGNNENYDVTASVFYAPTISDTYFTYRVIESTLLRIDCSNYTTEGNPSATNYTWTYRGSTISNGAVLDINNITRRESGRYRCSAANTHGSDYAYFTVTVQYAPKVYNSHSTLGMLEYSNLGMYCTSYIRYGNVYSTSYKWSYGGSTVSNSSHLAIRNISRSQAGNYTCTAFYTLAPTGRPQQQGIAKHDVMVIVQYIKHLTLTISASAVSENDSVTIVCSVVSKPSIQMTIRNIDNYNVLVDREVTNHRRYIIQRTQCLHNGTYRCEAAGIFGGFKTTSTSLFIACSPRIDFRKTLLTNLYPDIRETSTMTADVIANPLPSFKWWRYIDDQVQPIPDYTVHSVQSKGLQTSLQVTVTSERDYGLYAVMAENTIGRTIIKYTIAPKVIYQTQTSFDTRTQDKSSYQTATPLSPTDVHVISIAPSTITLSWKSNANGGFEQSFSVDYRSEDSEWSSWKSEIPDPGEGRQMQTTITGLTENEQYFFQVYAMNTIGSSAKVMKGATTFSHTVGLGQGLRIGFGATFPVIVLLTVILIILYCRRRETAKGKTDANRQQQSMHMESREHTMAESGGYSGLDSPSAQEDQYERIQHDRTRTTIADGSQHLYENQY